MFSGNSRSPSCEIEKVNYVMIDNRSYAELYPKGNCANYCASGLAIFCGPLSLLLPPLHAALMGSSPLQCDSQISIRITLNSAPPSPPPCLFLSLLSTVTLRSRKPSGRRSLTSPPSQNPLQRRQLQPSSFRSPGSKMPARQPPSDSSPPL